MGEEDRRNQIVQAAFAVACRDGIARLTVRTVAVEAGVSHGLVLFHFGRKKRLVHALLDWVIAETSVLQISEDVARFPDARDRLDALLQQEMARLSHQAEQTRLFLEFWALGARHDEIRVRINAELERYRTAFRSIMDELLMAEPEMARGFSADGLASVVLSWVQGCAVQAMVDPEHFDADQHLAAVRGMIARARRPRRPLPYEGTSDPRSG